MRRFCWTILLAAWAASAPAAVRVETIDARRVEGTLVAIGAGRVTLQAGREKHQLPLDSVLEIVLRPGGADLKPDAIGPMDRRGQTVVVTARGDHVAASNLTFADGKLGFSHPLLGAAVLPAEAVDVVYLPPKDKTPENVRRRCAELKLTDRPRDVLVVARGTKELVEVEGFLKAIKAGTIIFNWKGKDREVSRGIARAIKLAAVGQKAQPSLGTVVAADGSAVSFTALNATAKAVTIEAPHLGKRSFPLSKAAAIRFRSSRLVALADLKPARVREHGFFDTTFAHRVNRSVGGGPLRIGGRVHNTGLGLHSFCELTYRLDAAYKQFVAVAGIDDSVRPAGDAEVTFLGDGKPLGEPVRLTGRDAPVTVRLDVGKVKVFTVRVDFGPDGLDAGDHVNLAPARLIK